MAFKLDEPNLEKIIVVGDKLLIKNGEDTDRTDSGLFLPPGVNEKEPLQRGYVVRVGPGFPIPAITEDTEPWMENEDVRYVPLQAQIGDQAVFLKNSGFPIMFNGEKYTLVPQAAVLMLVRDEGLFE